MILSALAARARKNHSAFIDNFDVNDISNYTISQDTGSPTWTITGSQMVGTNAQSTQSSCVRNSSTLSNGFSSIESSWQQDGGILFRFTNQSNYYLLALSDDSGSNPTANVRLFKRVAGTFTQLGTSINTTWPRGTSAVVKVTFVGTAIEVFFNGTSILSVTDSTYSSGLIGMRSNSSDPSFQNTFNYLSWGFL